MKRLERLERFDPIAVLDKVNELVDAMNSNPAAVIYAPHPVALPEPAVRKATAVRQMAVAESVEPAPKPPVDPKVQEVVGSYTNRAEAALNVAINRLIELKDTATVERIHRIWRRA